MNLKLGYGGTASELIRLINDSGVAKITDEDIKAAGNIQSAIEAAGGFATIVEAIHAVQTQMDVAGTTALEASDTVEGSINSLKASWQNFLTGLGRDDADMSVLTEQLFTSISTAADNAMPVIIRIAERFGDFIVTNMPIITEKINEYMPTLTQALLPAVLSMVGALIAGLVENLPMILQILWDAIQETLDQIGSYFAEQFPGLSWLFDNLTPIVLTCAGAFVTLKGAVAIYDVFKKVTGFFGTMKTALVGETVATEGAAAAQNGLNTAMKANPIMAIISIITSLISLLITLYMTNEDFRNAVNGFFEYLFNAFGEMWDKFMAFCDWLGSVFMDAFQAIGDFFVGLWDGICSGVQGFIDFICGIPQAVQDAFNGLVDFLTAPFKTAFNFIADLWNSTIGGFEFDLPDWVPIAGGSHIEIPEMPKFMATGGVVKEATNAIVGEAGPEAVIPLNHPQAQNLLTGGSLDGLTPEEIKQAIREGMEGFGFSLNGKPFSKAIRDDMDRTNGRYNVYTRRGLAT